MQRFHNILFVSNGVQEEAETLSQALKLATDNDAELSILLLCPQFPETFKQHKASYESFLIDKMNQAIQTAQSALNLDKKKEAISIEVEYGRTPDIRIIRHILRHSFDLLVKAVEPTESMKGFKALDMELLRKCPCPIFLHRPSKQTEQPLSIGVAIDPQEEEKVGLELARSLLRVSASLIKNQNGRLDIISCYEFPMEHYLRDSVWISISKAEFKQLFRDEEKSHAKALNALVDQAKIDVEYHIEHLKGRPEKMIPDVITKKKIDILVMGTVARTGISGFIIGNTAENILQKVDCSLLALKPNGFVSPVKAY